MYQLFVEDHFDAAHYLPEYQGKCEHLHGHRFKVVIRVSAASVGHDGMAYDFAEMKRMLRAALSELDHTCVNELPDFATMAPSSENIAAWLYEKLERLIPASGEVPEPRKNRALEKLRKAANCYYDLFNNGLCNRAAEFRQVFGFGGTAIADHRYNHPVLEARLEACMDEIIVRAALEQKVS
mgnify:CR=1 FL=1